MPKKEALPSPEVYKPSEVAKILRVDMRTIYGMIERKELPSFTVGRVIRIPAAAVNALLGKAVGAPTE